jgi:hypothetical protein
MPLNADKAVHNQGCDEDEVNKNWKGKKKCHLYVGGASQEKDTRKQWMSMEKISSSPGE